VNTPPSFDTGQKSEDYFSKSRPEMMRFVPAQAKRVLEFGCGEGAFSAALKIERGLEAWGVELDPAAAAEAARHLDKVLAGPLEDQLALLPEHYFDCIVFNDVLEHLVDPFTVLHRVKKLLHEGGVVVCSIPNARFFPAFIDFVFRKQWRYEDHGVWDRTHLRWFTQRSIAAMFDALGYDLLTLEGINDFVTWKFKLANMVAFGFLSDTRYMQFAVVARPR
jgi:2-polyprenyl-3-methyl-5-hydroxy-6-metoxy-1,4-benzoquinol methylase